MPPCIRHLPFDIAGDWHGLPFRVWAWHRGLWRMGNFFCMGLFLNFIRYPTPLRVGDVADDSLTTGMYMDMLHRNFLLAFPTVAVQNIKKGGIGTDELISLVEVFIAA